MTINELLSNFKTIADPNFMSLGNLIRRLEEDGIDISHQTLHEYKKAFDNCYKRYGDKWPEHIEPPYLINFSKIAFPSVQYPMLYYPQVKAMIKKHYKPYAGRPKKKKV